MIDASDYREGMARVGAAVHIVTTDGPAGRAGFTATAVASVSISPPTLLVCLNRGAAVHPAFLENRVLCVNTLADTQHEIASVFGGLTGLHGVERFSSASWTRLESGAPALEGALASFDCRIETIHEVATHSVLICPVVAIALGEMRPGLAWFARSWQRLSSG